MNGLTANCITCTGSITILSNLGMRFSRRDNILNYIWKNVNLTLQRELCRKTLILYTPGTLFSFTLLYLILYTHI